MFVSNFISEHRDIAVKILNPVAVAYLYFGIVEYMTFFPFAASMSFLA